MSLREMLAVGRSSDDVYVATPPGSGFLFGGCSLALALVAAAETVEGPMVPKSLHAWFLRPGQWGSEMTFSVQRWSDGRSFSTRHVTLNQGDRTIGEMATSFHVPGEGGDWYASPSSRVAAPEELSPARVRLPEQLIEIRPVNGGSGESLQDSLHPYWARPTAPIGTDEAMSCAALAFMSDYLVILSMYEAGPVIPPTATIRTISHSVWFHRQAAAGEWLLFESDPVSVTRGRGFAIGSVYSEAATLVASFSQELNIQP
jgi:acyl-CoA thioesterase-2